MAATAVDTIIFVFIAISFYWKTHLYLSKLSSPFSWKVSLGDEAKRAMFFISQPRGPAPVVANPLLQLWVTLTPAFQQISFEALY
jgi:hypothetical protein